MTARPRVVSAAEWCDELAAPRAQELEHTRRGHALAATRRRPGAATVSWTP